MKSFKINPARYSLEKRLIKTFEKLPITSGKCLSIGCGNELRYFSFTKRFNVDGVDILQPPKNTPSGFTYYQSDAANLPFKDSIYYFYNCITCRDKTAYLSQNLNEANLSNEATFATSIRPC